MKITAGCEKVNLLQTCCWQLLFPILQGLQTLSGLPKACPGSPTTLRNSTPAAPFRLFSQGGMVRRCVLGHARPWITPGRDPIGVRCRVQMGVPRRATSRGPFPGPVPSQVQMPEENMWRAGTADPIYAYHAQHMYRMHGGGRLPPAILGLELQNGSPAARIPLKDILKDP